MNQIYSSLNNIKMSPEMLASIKKEIRRFDKLYEELITLWNGELNHGDNAVYPETIIIGVIIHNMGFSGVSCQGYDHNDAVSELQKNLHSLKSIDNYHNGTYMTHYPFKIINDIIEGMELSEDDKW